MDEKFNRIPVSVIHLDKDGTVIDVEDYNLDKVEPDLWALKGLAASLLPVIREFYTHEENVQAFEAWLYGVLTIKDIVDTITAAHLYRVDLVQVEILDGFFNLSLRQWPLVFLIRYEIFDRDLLEVDIRNKSAEVLH